MAECSHCGASGFRVTANKEYVIQANGKKKVVSIGVSDYLVAIPTLGLGYLLAKWSNSVISRRYPPVYGEYYCNICGNEWDSGVDQPRTHAPNPDLLRMGSERLGEEEAAAAYYYQQRTADRNRKR